MRQRALALSLAAVVAAGTFTLPWAVPASALVTGSASQAKAVMKDVQARSVAASEQISEPSRLISSSIWHSVGLADARGRPVLLQGIPDWAHIAKKVSQRAPANTYVLPVATRRTIASTWTTAFHRIEFDADSARVSASKHHAAEARAWCAAAVAERAAATATVQTEVTKHLLKLDGVLVAKSRVQVTSAFKAGVYFKFFKGPTQVRDLALPVTEQITDMREFAVARAIGERAAPVEASASSANRASNTADQAAIGAAGAAAQAARAAASRAARLVSSSTATADAASKAATYAGHHSWSVSVDLLDYVNGLFAKLPMCGPFDTTSTGINDPGTCNPGLNIAVNTESRMQFFVSGCPLEVLAKYHGNAETAFAHDKFVDIRCDEHFTEPVGTEGAPERCGLSQWGASVVWNPTAKDWYFPFLKLQAASALAYSVHLEQGYPWSASATVAYCSPEFATYQ